MFDHLRNRIIPKLTADEITKFDALAKVDPDSAALVELMSRPFLGGKEPSVTLAEILNQSQQGKKLEQCAGRGGTCFAWVDATLPKAS